MAGYHNYSMSNNAVAAYENNEKPLSKWTKQEIINQVLEVNPALDEKLLKSIKVKILKSYMLHRTSWHHTSNYYNRTDFYSLDDEYIESIDNGFLEELASIKEEKKKVTEETWKCEYLVWSGTRKHPKAEKKVSIGTIKGNWFYLPDGSKKSVNANGFEKLERVKL